MKKLLVTTIMAALAAAPARAYWFGSPGASLHDGRASIQATYDTGTRSITPKNGGQDVDMDSSRLYIQYGRGFANGLDLFGRVMPETGGLDFDPGNYSPTIWGLGGGLHFSPAQNGPVHWGAQVSLDYNAGKDQGVKVKLTEVALAGGGSYRPASNVDVYGGISFMKSDITVGNSPFQAKYELSNTFGLYTGVGFYATPNLNLGFELHLINETIFGFTAAYHFGGGSSAPRRHGRRHR